MYKIPILAYALETAVMKTGYENIPRKNNGNHSGTIVNINGKRRVKTEEELEGEITSRFIKSQRLKWNR